MTPKEKAKELYEKFYYQLPSNLMDKVQDCTAYECALIAVSELIKEVNHSDVGYWKEVKQEIEKL
jgi:hypothetical protein